MFRTRFHYLHIGKTAGTATKSVMKAMNSRLDGKAKFVLHKHKVSLSDLPKDAQYLFAIREPLDRFYSGFYSRKRKGQPRHYQDWSSKEAWCFDRFPEANDLAEALSADDPLPAIIAMRSIGHIRRRLVDVLDDMHGALIYRKPAFILRQASVEADFRAFAKKFDLGPVPDFPQDDISAHRNQYGAAPPLSEQGVKNLRHYLSDDLEYYAALMSVAETVNRVDRTA
ncbi:sulfotransferase family 2 domain-containing protein [Actibacterium sp. 188UL27-1]|uniref:sulfotransferase family 2 domain-containing protein n=1 Tax=Actibacterium sp. 188UL27-1 TaxID=2786961 RepID=UPI001956AE10|nr:sulfotransferase family 2 domain-containing protein [Actibacterium sp. 188UL27-1]MBM7067580.1 sulfotransferase family 2 domain-containing protein [Actibacterium sp. 188UL27-1]